MLTEQEIIETVNSYRDNGILIHGEFWLQDETGRIAPEVLEYNKIIIVNYIVTALGLLRDVYGLDVTGIGVNQDVSQERVNIVILDKDPERLLTRLGIEDNAAYLGFSNLIICDRKFSDALLDADDFASGQFTELNDKELQSLQGEFWMHRRMVFLWMLVHEMGHLAKHRHLKMDYAELASSQLDLFRNIETEADQFMLEVLRADPGTDYAHAQAYRLWQGLHSFASRKAMELFGCTITTLIKQETVIVIPVRSRTHPPPLFRAILMNSILATEYEIERPNRYADLLKYLKFDCA